MVDLKDEADLKIVDFGLSKIIGPNETSLDPFGTLVRISQINPHLLIVLCRTRSSFTEALWQRGRPLESGCHHVPAVESCAPLR